MNNSSKMFVGLHNHDLASIGDSLMSSEDLVKKTKELGMNSVAITNHGSLASFIQFKNACVKHSIKPIFGCEFYFVEDVNSVHVINDRMTVIKETIKTLKKNKIQSKETKKEISDAQTSLEEAKELWEVARKYTHLIILAKNKEGFDNLVKLHNDAVIDGFYRYPRISWDTLEKHKDGLIGSSSCLGSKISKLLASDNMDDAIETVYKFKKIFGPNNFYIELQLHDIKLQTEVNHKAIELGKLTNTLHTLTLDAHYLNEGEGFTRSLIRKLNKEEPEVNNDDVLESLFLKNEDMILKAWLKYMPGTDIKILTDAIMNTRKISDSVETFEFDTSLKFPLFDAGTLSQEDFLSKAAWDGLKQKRLDGKIEYVKRLKHELNTVSKLGFASYFNVVADIMNDTRKYQPLSVGRGSSSGSLLGYCLGITEVDPIEFGLYFERFLSADKGIMSPTFGLDLTKVEINYDQIINSITMNKHKHDNNCVCGC